MKNRMVEEGTGDARVPVSWQELTGTGTPIRLVILLEGEACSLTGLSCQLLADKLQIHGRTTCCSEAREIVKINNADISTRDVAL